MVENLYNQISILLESKKPLNSSCFDSKLQESTQFINSIKELVSSFLENPYIDLSRFVVTNYWYIVLVYFLIRFLVIYRLETGKKLFFYAENFIYVSVTGYIIVEVFSYLFLSNVSEDNFVKFVSLILVGILVITVFFADSIVVFNFKSIVELPLLIYLIFSLSLSMLSADNFAFLIICLEGFSLTLYIMSTFNRTHGGIAAATKYFTFGTAGSILILWGMVHIYEVTTSLSFDVIAYAYDYLNENVKTSSNLLFKLEWASNIIIFGLLVKLGAAPLHQWVADTYSGVPLYITTVFAILVKTSLFAVFIKLMFIFHSSLELEYAAIFSLIVGCFSTLRQVEIKRFLAYGSITHVGFLLSGDFTASFIYLLAYVLSSLIFFSILLTLRFNGKELIYLSDLRYVSTSGYKWDRTLIVLALSSMAGLPPFAGFYGKMLIWSSLIEDIYLFNDTLSYVVLFVNLITSLIVIFYYMRLITIIYLDNNFNKKSIVTSYLINTAYNSSEFSYQKERIIRLGQYCSSILIVFWTLVMPLLLTILEGLFDKF